MRDLIARHLSLRLNILAADLTGETKSDTAVQKVGTCSPRLPMTVPEALLLASCGGRRASPEKYVGPAPLHKLRSLSRRCREEQTSE